jgi:hypothetical protein
MSKLLPDWLKEKIPPLYSSERLSNADKRVVVKYFSPYSNWKWFAVEGEADGNDFIFFGLVHGHCMEWGYFSLSELESCKRDGLPLIERDEYFDSATISELGLDKC